MAKIIIDGQVVELLSKVHAGESGIPNGGTTGQYLVKASDADGDVTWGDGVGASGEVYSTEETVVGTFLGKPLYRKVYNATTPTASNTTMLSYAISYEVVRLYGFFTPSTGGGRYMLPSEYYSSTVNYWCHLHRENHVVMFGTTESSFKGQPAVVILEYTKTTDTPIATSAAALFSQETLNEMREVGLDKALLSSQGTATTSQVRGD